MRALVADSDPDRLRQLEGWLTQWGYDVWPARNGVEAWNRLSSEKSPVVAVLAWEMDAMHGIDVCRRIRLQPELPTAYVLLVAERREPDYLLEGLNAGADDFLLAPFDPVETRARVRTGARIVEVEEALRASQEPSASSPPATASRAPGTTRPSSTFLRRSASARGARADRSPSCSRIWTRFGRSTRTWAIPSGTRSCAKPRGA